MSETIIQLWWVFLLVGALVLYKFVLRVLCGMIIVPDDRIGLVVKKFTLYGSNLFTKLLTCCGMTENRQ